MDVVNEVWADLRKKSTVRIGEIHIENQFQNIFLIYTQILTETVPLSNPTESLLVSGLKDMHEHEAVKRDVVILAESM